MTDYLSTSDGDSVNGFTLGGVTQVNNSTDDTIVGVGEQMTHSLLLVVLSVMQLEEEILLLVLV